MVEEYKRKPIPYDIIKQLNHILHCERCKDPLPLDSPDRQKHHIKYVCDGGTDKVENIEILCLDCHYAEHEEYWKRKGVTLEEYKRIMYKKTKKNKAYYIRKIAEKLEEMDKEDYDCRSCRQHYIIKVDAIAIHKCKFDDCMEMKTAEFYKFCNRTKNSPCQGYV